MARALAAAMLRGDHDAAQKARDQLADLRKPKPVPALAQRERKAEPEQVLNALKTSEPAREQRTLFQRFCDIYQDGMGGFTRMSACQHLADEDGVEPAVIASALEAEAPRRASPQSTMLDYRLLR